MSTRALQAILDIETRAATRSEFSRATTARSKAPGYGTLEQQWLLSPGALWDYHRRQIHFLASEGQYAALAAYSESMEGSVSSIDHR